MLQVLDLKQIRLQLTLELSDGLCLTNPKGKSVPQHRGAGWKCAKAIGHSWVTWNSKEILRTGSQATVPGHMPMKQVRYTGALPFKVLYVRRRTLNTIRCFTGSQCRDSRTGLMCSYFFVSVTSLAAMFWMHWSFAIWASGSPNKRLLQLSMRDVMKAWTSFSVTFLSR